MAPTLELRELPLLSQTQPPYSSMLILFSGGRITRSGTEFSPYTITPLQVTDFDIDAHMLNDMPAAITAESSDEEDGAATFAPT
jgi:hypothetical protein